MSETNLRKDIASTDEIDLVELMQEIWRLKWLLISLVLIAMIGTGAYSKFFITPVYQANALLQCQEASSVSHIINSLGFRKQVDKAIELLSDEGDSIESSLSSSTTGYLIDVRVQAEDPEMALAVLNTVVNLIQQVQEQRIAYKQDINYVYLEELRTQIEVNERVIKQTLEQINELLSLEESAANLNFVTSNLIVTLGIHVEERLNLLKEKTAVSRELVDNSLLVISPPYLPEEPIMANYMLNAAIAGAVAIMAGLLIVFIKSAFISNK